MSEIKIQNENERVIAGWVSVEIKDLQGDIVPVEEMEKAMYKLMDRGGQIIFGHQNKPVGKILRWEIREHPETGKPGVWVVAKIFNHYPIDDMVWKMIKEGKIKGFSIGGVGKSKTIMVKENGQTKPVNVLTDIQLMEVSLVEKPANPYAKIEYVNRFAKGSIELSEVDHFMRKDDGWYAIMKDGSEVAITEEEFNGIVRREWIKRIEDKIKKLCKIDISIENIDIDKIVENAEPIINAMLDEVANAMYGEDFDALSPDEQYAVRKTARDIVDMMAILNVIGIREGWFDPIEFEEEVEKGIVFDSVKSVMRKVRKKEKLTDVEKKILSAIIRLAKMLRRAITKEELEEAIAKGFIEIMKPFAGFKNFEDCVRHMKEQYKDKYSGEKLEEVARKVCGKLYWEYEKSDGDDRDRLRDRVANIIYGKPYSELTDEEKDKVCEVVNAVRGKIAEQLDVEKKFEEFKRSVHELKKAISEYKRICEAIKKEDSCKSRYVDENGRFKEMTCPDNPSEKSRFCGCVRYFMNCKGMSLEQAKKMCGYIKHYVKKGFNEPIADKDIESIIKEFAKKNIEVAKKLFEDLKKTKDEKV